MSRDKIAFCHATYRRRSRNVPKKDAEPTTMQAIAKIAASRCVFGWIVATERKRRPSEENVARTAHTLRSGDRQAAQVQCVVSKRLWSRDSVCDGRYGLSVRIKSIQSGNDQRNRARTEDLDFRCRVNECSGSQLCYSLFFFFSITR